MIKNCFYCNSKFTKKNGKVYGEQRYKCFNCKKQFIERQKPDKEAIWKDYVTGKQN